MSRLMHKTAVVLLLVVGVQLWLLVGRGQYGAAPPLTIFLAGVVIASLPPVYRRVSAWLDRARDVTPRTRMLVALGVFLLATPLLYWTAVYQQRELFPKMHDEYMHLLQVQMLARGRLWMPPHEVADSFESFHIFVKPVYASIYFPGASLMHVPATWLSLPYAAMPCVIAGACASMLYRVAAELLDTVYGLLAALMLVALSQFRYVSMIVVSHSAMLLLGLAMMWAWLRWRRTPSVRWAAAIGFFAGWSAITRPVDAICYAVPVGGAIMWTMFRQRWPWRRIATTGAAVIAAATPFLALQIVFNVGVTGRWNETPYRRYADLFTPGMTFGFHQADANAQPHTTLPQRLAYYHDYTLTATKTHRPELLWRTWTRERFPLLATRALPSELLLVLIPPALLGLRRGVPGRGVLLSTLLLFVGLYAFFAYLLLHYVVPFTPAITVAVLLGAQVVADSFPRARAWLVTVLTTIIVMLSLRGLPQFNRVVADDTLVFPTLRFDQRLPWMIQTPALVLYRFNPATDDPDEEPVYNVEVAWPDDATIVRAHDLSPEQNARLLRYYADRQPDRHVYVVERARVTDADYRPRYLGRTGEIAAGPQ
jgi:hypothetical protein